MRSILKGIQRDPCRAHELSENDRSSFSHYTHLQRYFPALDLFTIPESALSHKNMELPTKYQIQEWISQDRPKHWMAKRAVYDQPDQTEDCEVFTKVVHLLNPIDMIKEKYVCPSIRFFLKVKRHGRTLFLNFTVITIRPMWMPLPISY
jgi:hypothetical protein